MNIKEEHSRTAYVYGEEAINKLSQARVAVFGVGGVGGYICEALCRAGVGHIDVFDRDTVSLSNINRQIIALHSTVKRRIGDKRGGISEGKQEVNSSSCKIRAYRAVHIVASLT